MLPPVSHLTSSWQGGSSPAWLRSFNDYIWDNFNGRICLTLESSSLWLPSLSFYCSLVSSYPRLWSGLSCGICHVVNNGKGSNKTNIRALPAPCMQQVYCVIEAVFKFKHLSPSSLSLLFTSQSIQITIMWSGKIEYLPGVITADWILIPLHFRFQATGW